MEDATIAYLTNPIYFSELEKREKPDSVLTDDVKFYRRRLISLHKRLLDGDSDSKSVRQAHQYFLHTAIEHFKRIDTEQALQKEYDGVQDDKVPNDKVPSDKVPNDEADEIVNGDLLIAKTKRHVSTLDGFVTSNKSSEREATPPQKRVVNLRDEQFRHKGVAKKKVSIHEAKSM